MPARKELSRIPVIKKSNEERCYALFKGNIRKRMEAEQVTDKQMAAVTGMHEDTFAKKKNHPERFTYPELMQVFKKLKFPDCEILESMR